LDEYGACSVLALSSIEETAPVVIGQAMAAGKPVVSTAVGGIAHMINEGGTGYLVHGRQVETLAARLIQVLTDDALRHAMGQAARQVANDRFTPEVAAARTYAAYQEVTGAA
jgi:glycosyltransferase involved in cell wall biosynthesis